jgi:hypothetical protein
MNEGKRTTGCPRTSCHGDKKLRSKRDFSGVRVKNVLRARDLYLMDKVALGQGVPVQKEDRPAFDICAECVNELAQS